MHNMGSGRNTQDCSSENKIESKIEIHSYLPWKYIEASDFSLEGNT